MVNSFRSLDLPGLSWRTDRKGAVTEINCLAVHRSDDNRFPHNRLRHPPRPPERSINSLRRICAPV